MQHHNAMMILESVVVKGYDVLQLREVFDVYPTTCQWSFPKEMLKVDYSFVTVSSLLTRYSSQSLSRWAATDKRLFCRSAEEVFAEE